jgi:tripartite-type tricarboxylate transporter receptor subunit TctC
MPGADGLKATNYIYNMAPRDGSVIALTNAQMTLQPLYTDRGVQFDPFKLNWLGAMGKQYNLCLTWKASPIKTIQDAQAHVTTVSSTGATGAYTVVPNILNAVIGTKFKVISGYETAGTSLAVERGEVDGICGASYSTLMASNPSWITEKKINFLAQLAPEPDSKFPDVPMVLDMVKNLQDRRMLDLILVVQEVGRPVIAPPDLPADRLAALQSAFIETMRDSRFRAEADKRRLDIDMLDHSAVERILKNAYATPKDVVARAARLVLPKQ